MLYCTFRRFSLLSFYIFFESRSVPPSLFPVLDWGYQPEQVRASIYLFYALLASLPSLAGILFIYSSFSSLCLFLLHDSVLVGSCFMLVCFCLFWL